MSMWYTCLFMILYTYDKWCECHGSCIDWYWIRVYGLWKFKLVDWLLIGIGWPEDSLINRRDDVRLSIGFIWLLICDMLCGRWLDYMIESKHDYVLRDIWLV